MPFVRVCDSTEIEEEDVRRFDYGGKSYAVYRSGGHFYATDGLCTHEHIHLADGLVIGNIIECPKHNGRFDIRTGRAKGAPACIDLKTYPVQVADGAVYIELNP